jgi:hypothetical protein
MTQFAIRLLACLSVFFSVGVAMATEEPRFDLITKENDFELRRYQAMIIAEVQVTGTLSGASNQGFRQVADFIFGNNEDPVKKKSEKIDMTAPVTLELDVSTKIAMTAPVTIEEDKARENKGQTWKLAFVMPEKFTMETLPKPKNANITIRSIPAQQVAVVTFSGWVDEEKMALQTQRLEEWVKKNAWKTSGPAQLSRYNPPWTLPFWRRNEIWLKLD